MSNESRQAGILFLEEMKLRGSGPEFDEAFEGLKNSLDLLYGFLEDLDNEHPPEKVIFRKSKCDPRSFD